MEKEFEYPKLLSIGEVAEMFNITAQEVRKQCKSGLIKAERSLNGRGSWRIDADTFFGVYPEKREEFRNRDIEHKESMVKVFKMLDEMAKSGEYDGLLNDNKDEINYYTEGYVDITDNFNEHMENKTVITFNTGSYVRINNRLLYKSDK